MTKFLVNIRAYGYHARFIVEAEDNAESIENSIVDKLGDKSIKWEKDGFISKSKVWLTYEEVIDATTSQRLIQTEEKSRDRMGGASA